jgi:hypothetical protein
VAALKFFLTSHSGLSRRTASKVRVIRSEDNKMHRFLVLSALVLSATMIGPVVGQAADPHEKRYYDRDGHDYHAWNSNEDHAYRVYLQEQHQNYRDFNKVKRTQQQQYFKWRHTHPDNALLKIEIR